MAKKKTKDFGEVILAKMAEDPELAETIQEELFRLDVAQKVFALREAAGLKQKELASLIGTQQPVISRIEDANYEGHSIKTLKKIARALNKRLEVNFVDPEAIPITVSAEIQTSLSWSYSVAWNQSINSIVNLQKDILVGVS